MALVFVTDRTQADIDYLRRLRAKPWSEMKDEEEADWNSASLKGAYNYTDLNRVETAVATLASELTGLGFPVFVNTKTNWNLWDVPTAPVMLRYLQNLIILQNAVDVFAGLTPTLPPEMKNLDFDGANRIEQMLQTIDGWIIGMKNNTKYSGEYFCGE